MVKTKVPATMDREIIGEIRYAMLTEEQFQAQAGKNWVLADGREVEGSRYQQLTGNLYVPDARGMFLRGKNNKRSDGNQNPEGDLYIGQYQPDTIKEHNHDAGTYQSLDYYHPDYSHSWDDAGIEVDPNEYISSSWRQVRGNSGFSGSVENRPKNITINVFIKIN